MRASPENSRYREAIARVFSGRTADEIRGLSAKQVCSEARKYLPNALRPTLDPRKASIAVLVSLAKRPITGGHATRGRPRKALPVVAG